MKENLANVMQSITTFPSSCLFSHRVHGFKVSNYVIGDESTRNEGALELIYNRRQHWFEPICNGFGDYLVKYVA